MNPSSTVGSGSMAGGMSKVFMLDKYFTELQKFLATEKCLQGNSDSTPFYKTLAKEITVALKCNHGP